jgi:hypothetical protein
MSKVMEALKKRAGWRTPAETLKDLYAKRNQSEVARVLGVDQTTVSDAMKRLRITARPRRTPTPKGYVAQELTRRGRTTRRSANQMFVLLYRTRGLSLREIADQLFASREAVRTFANERNISLRRQGRPNGSTRKAAEQSFNHCI